MDQDNDLHPAVKITGDPQPEVSLAERPRARIGRPPATVGYAAMSREQLLEECRQLYKREGIAAFTFEALKRSKLYYVLYNKGLKLADVLAELGLEEEYRRRLETMPIRRAGRDTLRWTWARILSVAREVAEREGSLPTALWFQSNGNGSLVAALYNLGKPGLTCDPRSRTSPTATLWKVGMVCDGSATLKHHCPIFFTREVLNIGRVANIRRPTLKRVGDNTAFMI
jgi:hypothetical protein